MTHVPRFRFAWLTYLFGLACLGLVPSMAAIGQETAAPPPGLRENVPSVHALVGAKIILAPGQVIEKGTLVIRDGVIAAVGPDVIPPADARVLDLTGKTIYPGFIDAYTSVESVPPSPEEAGNYWNSNIAPQVEARTLFKPDPAANKRFRGQGVVARLLVPSAGIIKGTSALVTTGDAGDERGVLVDSVGMHAQLFPSGSSTERYPNSPMGAMTLARQALYDAQWHADSLQRAQAQAVNPRPEYSRALSALAPVLRKQQTLFVESPDRLYLLRADKVAREFDLNLIVVGSGQEYQRLEAVKATGRGIVVPLAFPKAPNVDTPEGADSVSLAELMDWDIAPENPGRLAAAGIPIAFTSNGIADPATFLGAVRTAVGRGLSEEDALRALTQTPARWFGAENMLGSLAAGKSASFIVADGNLLAADSKAKIEMVWVDGSKHALEAPPPVDVTGAWEVQLAQAEGADAAAQKTVTLNISGSPQKPSGNIKWGDKEISLSKLTVEAQRLSASFKSEDPAGVVRLSAVIVGEGDAITFTGRVDWPDGTRTRLAGKRAPPMPEAAPAEAAPATETKPGGEPGEEPKPAEENKPDASPSDAPSADSPRGRRGGDSAPAAPKMALYPVNYPFGDFGREAPVERPNLVAFTHATIWTSGPAGIVQDGTLIVEGGIIKAVGAGLAVPDGALVVDCTGKHISPGIIDCHSHIATDGGVNESGQTITAEVRISDFIDSDDIAIYRQLAGGTTAANILHGSANTIGGQNQVIKFRWGALPEELKFEGAPLGIKFALGENVKQSNMPAGANNPRSRYPQSRMGVEQLVADAFLTAREYRDRWSEWRSNKQGLPPRVDLELEALVEVLEGRRLIHCHSYRQDEILAFMRMCERFGVRIASLQHILEGYKLANAMANHGAGGSSFSDWWAYKFEVYDAIPYNGALMHRAGVVVSFNSDDAELGRRLNWEAAKAVKYGGVEPAEALKFVTLNPARQLGVDGRVGSLEVGKDGDLVVWSGSPLSTYSRCEQTWIDGRKYFDREADLQLQAEAQARKGALIQRILDSGAPMAGPGESGRPRMEWAREDEFCRCRQLRNER